MGCPRNGASHADNEYFLTDSVLLLVFLRESSFDTQSAVSLLHWLYVQ